MGTDIGAVTVRLKAILATDLGLNFSADEIRDNHPLMADGLSLDSIGLVELIALVEEKFQFQVQEEDLTMTTFENVSSLAEIISRRVGG